MRPFVVTPPAPIVAWEEADAHLRLDGDEDQRTMVERLVKTATSHIDGPGGWLNRALGPQTIEVRMCGFGNGLIRLPYAPVIDIVSAHYLDGLGQPQLIDPAAYELFGDVLGNAWGQSWPTPGAYRGRAETVRIQYRAGFAVDPAADPVVHNVPEPIRHAILLMVGDMYRFPETVAEGTVGVVPMSTTVENLLQPFQIYR